MEQQFEYACRYLTDHSELLYCHVPIPDLLEMMRDYYCSELLFEQKFPVVHELPQGYDLARLLFSSKNRLVLAYGDSLRLLRNEEANLVNNFFADVWLAVCVQRWTDLETACCRPRCFWRRHCSCGWPLLVKRREFRLDEEASYSSCVDSDIIII